MTHTLLPKLNEKKWQAIVFDMDDTLFPEQAFVLSGFRAVAQWAESIFPITFDESFKYLSNSYHSGVRGHTFNDWLSEFGLNAELLPTCINVYREHTPRIQPFPEMPAFLTNLRKSGYKIGLVSDGYLSVQQGKFQALNIARHFDAVIFSDEYGRANWKPSPIPYCAVLEKLQVLPAQSVYLGDNPKKDFLGAKRAGMDTIWCRYSGGDYSQLSPPSSDHQSDFVANDLIELIKAFDYSK